MAREAVEDIIRFLRDLASDENMRVTIQETARGGLIAGGACVMGGLLLGPVGLAAGGAVGGLVAAATSTSFKPVAQVIYEMPHHQKEKLTGQVRDILNNHGIQTLAALAVTTGASGVVRREVVQELQRFVASELQMALA